MGNNRYIVKLIVIAKYAPNVKNEQGGITMYHYKITTNDKVEIFGISSDIQDLQNLLYKKITYGKVTGKVEILEGKKVIASYLEK